MDHLVLDGQATVAAATTPATPHCLRRRRSPRHHHRPDFRAERGCGEPPGSTQTSHVRGLDLALTTQALPSHAWRIRCEVVSRQNARIRGHFWRIRDYVDGMLTLTRIWAT